MSQSQFEEYQNEILNLEQYSKKKGFGNNKEKMRKTKEKIDSLLKSFLQEEEQILSQVHALQKQYSEIE